MKIIEITKYNSDIYKADLELNGQFLTVLCILKEKMHQQNGIILKN